MIEAIPIVDLEGVVEITAGVDEAVEAAVEVGVPPPFSDGFHTGTGSLDNEDIESNKSFEIPSPPGAFGRPPTPGGPPAAAAAATAAAVAAATPGGPEPCWGPEEATALGTGGCS